MTAPLRLSQEQADALRALQEGRDPYVFATQVLGIRLNPAQRRWFRLIQPDKTGWQWRYHAVCHVAANQIGKTLGLAALILWACWYKIGVPTEDGDRWMAAPYTWFHLAPRQPQAYLTKTDMEKLLEGRHEAQIDPETQRYRPVLIPKGLVQEVTIEVYYKGFSLWNGALIQFRTTDDQAKALQGRRAAGISFDEAAFEDHLKATVNETLLMRLIASGGPLWLVSTPDGINDWYEIVTNIQDESLPREVALPNDPLTGGSAVAGELLPMWVTPDRWALLWSTIDDNVGFGVTAEARERMERTVDAATKEQQLRGAFLEPREAYFVPSAQVDLAFRDLPPEALPLPDHAYVISWDPSATTDPTVVIVIDVTKRPWRGVYFRHYEKPLGETKLLTEIYAVHALYNGASTMRMRGQRPPRALTTWDGTSMGGAMLTQALIKLSPKLPLNLAGPNTKRDALSNLRTALNTLQLVIPRSWTQVRREVLTYKLPDDKIKQDCVMALLGAANAAAKGFGGSTTATLSIHGRIAQH